MSSWSSEGGYAMAEVITEIPSSGLGTVREGLERR
jgi:hypothetical protein